MSMENVHVVACPTLLNAVVDETVLAQLTERCRDLGWSVELMVGRLLRGLAEESSPYEFEARLRLALDVCGPVDDGRGYPVSANSPSRLVKRLLHAAGGLDAGDLAFFVDWVEARAKAPGSVRYDNRGMAVCRCGVRAE